VLGRGGMGIVYAAHDRTRGHAVALKCLSLERLSSEGDRKRFTALFEREYYALSQLEHPHIIRAYDFGLDELGPFYSMELLHGDSLRTRAPWAWATACRLLRDIASALSHLHARALVHRDVTPLNIYCTPDGRAKLIDFGAMMPAGVPKQVVGTPAFIAPECVEGQSVDGRTDLFALGACLYYALTGQHAYPARTLLEVRQMWQTPPSAISTLAPDVPPALEELVFALLHLRPENRPRTAADVYERLSVIAGLPRDESGAETAAYLAHPKLVGRDKQERSLRRRAQRAAAGGGGCTVLSARAGLGRSRMLDVAARQAQLAGLRVARADASAGTLGDFAVAQRLLAGLSADDAALEQALRELGALEVQSGPGSAGDAPRREQRLAELSRALLSVCARTPCALLVDDVHAIDAPSLAFLAELATRVHEQQLLIVTTCDQDATPSSNHALALLSRSARKLELLPLEAAETRELVVSLFGEVPNVDLFSSLLQQHGKGVPGRIVHAAEACLRAGLVRQEGGSYFIASAKDALLGVIAEHTRPERAQAPVSAEAAELLAAIALDRYELQDVASYQKLLGLPESGPLFRALIELRDARRVEWLDERVRLAHEVERTPASAVLSEARRLELQRRLADACDAQQLPRIFAAYHLLCAGDSELERAFVAMDDFHSYVDAHPQADVLRHPATLEATERACRVPDFPGAHPALRTKYQAALLLNAVYVGRMDLVAGRLPQTLRDIAHWSGVEDYAALSELPPEQRLMQALTRAAERCNQPGVGALDVVFALRRMVQLSIQAPVVASFMRDASLLSAIPDLEPFRPLSPAVAIGARLVEGLARYVRGQLWAAVESLREVQSLLAAPEAATLEPFTRMALERTVLPYLSGIAADAGAPSADELSARCAQFMPDLAEMQRCRYHMARGDFAAAAAARQRFELLSVRAGTFSDSRIVELPAQLSLFALCQDSIGLSRTVQTLREVVRTRLGFAPCLQLATALWLRSQGQIAQALELTERALAEHTPPHADWQPTAALHVELLTASGRAAQAIELGQQYLATAERTLLPGYRIALALADANMHAGRHADAEQSFARSTSELEQHDVFGVVTGCAYELGARVALARKDAAVVEERVERCRSHFELGDHPGLRARYNALLRDARRMGAYGVKPAQVAGRAELRRALRARLDQLVALATQHGEAADFHRGLLDVLIEQGAAVGGVLYLRRAAQLTRLAAVGKLEARSGLDELVRGSLLLSADDERTVVTDAVTQRMSSTDLALYTIARPGHDESFVAALEVGLLERRRIDVSTLEEIASSLERSLRTESSILVPSAASGENEDTEDLFG